MTAVVNLIRTVPAEQFIQNLYWIQ